MQGIETTHFCVVINESIDEFLLSVWDDTVTIISNKRQKSGLLDFLKLFGNINDKIGKGLHLLLGVFEILHILHQKKVTK
jgi:hypothetical protein